MQTHSPERHGSSAHWGLRPERVSPEASALPSKAAGGKAYHPSGTGRQSPAQRFWPPAGRGLHPGWNLGDPASDPGPPSGFKDGEQCFPSTLGPASVSTACIPVWRGALASVPGRQMVPDHSVQKAARPSSTTSSPTPGGGVTAHPGFQHEP